MTLIPFLTQKPDDSEIVAGIKIPKFGSLTPAEHLSILETFLRYYKPGLQVISKLDDLKAQMEVTACILRRVVPEITVEDVGRELTVPQMSELYAFAMGEMRGWKEEDDSEGESKGETPSPDAAIASPDTTGLSAPDGLDGSGGKPLATSPSEKSERRTERT
jgi:hypothetical protein